MEVKGFAKFNSSAGSGTVSFGSRSLDAPANYNVLGTDYENYAVVYNCVNKAFGLSHSKVVWILSRTPVLSEDLMKEAQVLIELKLPDYSPSVWAVNTYQGDDCGYKNWDQG